MTRLLAFRTTNPTVRSFKITPGFIFPFLLLYWKFALVLVRLELAPYDLLYFGFIGLVGGAQHHLFWSHRSALILSFPKGLFPPTFSIFARLVLTTSLGTSKSVACLNELISERVSVRLYPFGTLRWITLLPSPRRDQERMSSHPYMFFNLFKERLSVCSDLFYKSKQKSSK